MRPIPEGGQNLENFSRSVEKPGVFSRVKNLFSPKPNLTPAFAGINADTAPQTEPTQPDTKQDLIMEAHVSHVPAPRRSSSSTGITSPLPRGPQMPRRDFLKLAKNVGIFTVIAGTGAIGVKELIDHTSIVSDAKQKITQEGGKAVVTANTKQGLYELPPPPGRQAENISTILSQVELQNIPTIPDNDATIPLNAILGFNGFLTERQSLQQGPDGVLKTMIFPPSARLTGYLVGKEKQADGSILFAIELPYLSGTKDIKSRDYQSASSDIETKKITSGKDLPPADEITVGGAIVWIKLYNNPNPTYTPFVSTIAWSQEGFYRQGPVKVNLGTGQDALAKFARVGDPISADISISLDVNSTDVNKELKDYVSLYNYGNNVDVLKTNLQQDTSKNMQTAQSLVADAGKSISFNEELAGKRYIFTAGLVSFIPK